MEAVLLAGGYSRVDAKGFDRERSIFPGGALTQEGQARWSRYRLPLQDHSEHKAGHSVHKVGHSEHSDELDAIASLARRQKRLQPAEMENIILKLCQGRWLTRNELAERLDRHPDGLRSRFLTPMVAHGHLRLRYPDKPNRTDQSYTAALVNDNAVSLTNEPGKLKETR